MPSEKIFIFLAHKMQKMLAFRVRTKPTAQLCKHLGKCSQFSRERTLNRMDNQEKANPKVIQMLTINKDFKVVIISVTHEVKKTQISERKYKKEPSQKFRTENLIPEINISLSGFYKRMMKTKTRLKIDQQKLSNLKKIQRVKQIEKQ